MIVGARPVLIVLNSDTYYVKVKLLLTSERKCPFVMKSFRKTSQIIHTEVLLMGTFVCFTNIKSIRNPSSKTSIPFIFALSKKIFICYSDKSSGDIEKYLKRNYKDPAKTPNFYFVGVYDLT